MPTTPFAILAAYLFSKSSPRLYNAIKKIPILGPGIQDWEDHRVIRPGAKFGAIFMVVCVFGTSLMFGPPIFELQVFLVLVAMSVVVFVLTRRSYPRIQ